MSPSQRKTVQEYIDETPRWPDGTLLVGVPMTPMQWRIWALATGGKFFEGLVVFMTGVALPLMALEFQLGSMEKGLTSAASLFGILIGAAALGGLSDRFGRKQMFIAEMVLFTGFLVLATLSPNFTVLAIALFGMGLALGCDYPTAHLMISESIPSGCRGRLVLSAFGFQAVGAMAGTVLGFLILRLDESVFAWRMMFATAILPAVFVTAARFFITQSGHWLVVRGRLPEAERELLKLLRREPLYPRAITLHDPHAGQPRHQGTHFWTLFSKKKNRRAAILASVPWFLQDLGTYGIGIFTPMILVAAFGHSSQDPRNLAEVIHRLMRSAEGAALVDVLLVIGIIAAVFLVDRVGRIRLQILGFVGCAAGLLMAAVVANWGEGPLRAAFLFLGFMVFNFMTNLGPNAMTYLLAGEVFPTRIRGIGAGFAASFAKAGAVSTALLFPWLLDHLGVSGLLCILAGTSLAGAAITWLFGIETRGLNLEKIADS